MSGEFPNSESPDELRQLWDASPPSDGLSEETEDYLLALDAAIGTDPSPEILDRVSQAAERYAAMDEAQIEELVADAHRHSPLANFMREVLPAMIESDDASPVPLHRSVHAGNPGGFTQQEWDALPESTKRLLRKRDEPEKER